MNILQINKFYHIVGGVDRYFFELSELLEKNGHFVSHFSTKGKLTRKSKWSKYFIDEYDYSDINIRSALPLFARMIYSVEAKRKINQLLDDYKWDIVHLHDIFHHISPSILPEIKKRNIPIVQTVGDYHLISPNYNMFQNGKICEITKPDKFYKTIFHKCVKNSFALSLAEVIEKYVHYWLGWERDYIDYFIVPSQFMKRKLIEYGISPKKIVYLPYCIELKKYDFEYRKDDNYILYFGRLSPEKGLRFLLSVIKILPNVKLKIVGKGSEEEKLKNLCLKLDLENVELLGFHDGNSLKKLIARSKFTILPSLWYDVAPVSIIESFASGRPVIASNIGGIPELVKDGYNGFLFEPGNLEDCAEKITRLWSNPALCRKLGKNVRLYIEKNFSAKDHYEKIMDIYKKVIKVND